MQKFHLMCQLCESLGTACNIMHPDGDIETWPREKWWNDVIASAVMTLWSVSLPLNQAACMW